MRLRSGKLAVFSPVALTEEARAHVDKLGKVAYISCLDFEHHVFMGPWHQAFPDATVIGVEGLPEKRAKQKNEDIRFDKVFTSSNKDTLRIDDEFDAEFDYEYMPSHGNKELVFNYKTEGALIEGDLMFNAPPTEQYSRTNEDAGSGLLTKFFSTFTNTAGSALWHKRFLWYAMSSGDRPGFNKSVAKIDRWNFDRIIPCHGDVIESGGKGVFRKVFDWHLQAAQRQGAA